MILHQKGVKIFDGGTINIQDRMVINLVLLQIKIKINTLNSVACSFPKTYFEYEI